VNEPYAVIKPASREVLEKVNEGEEVLVVIVEKAGGRPRGLKGRREGRRRGKVEGRRGR